MATLFNRKLFNNKLFNRVLFRKALFSGEIESGVITTPYVDDLIQECINDDFVLSTQDNKYFIQSSIGEYDGDQHDGLTVTSNGSNNYLDTGYIPNGDSVWIVQGKFNSLPSLGTGFIVLVTRS
jgi:hypothetical protein